MLSITYVFVKMKQVIFYACLSTIFLFCWQLLNAQVAYGEWELLNPRPTNNDLRSVAFVNESSGFVSDYQHTFHTTDFGETWELREDLPGADAIEFLGNKGVLVRNSLNEIYTTDDGGANWTSNTIPDVYGLNRCQLVSENIIIATTFDKLVYSLDGGESWMTNNLPWSDITDSYFREDGTGVIVTYNGRILVTEDGGDNWTETHYNYSHDFSMVEFVNDSIGFAPTGYGETPMLKTTDGGTTWVEAPEGFSSNYNAMKFEDENVGYLCADNGNLYKVVSEDGSWEQIEFTDISESWTIGYDDIFSDGNDLFVVGEQGWIFRSWDGGATWTNNHKLYFDIRNLYFFNAEIGFAVTNYADRLFKTYDGGLNWEEIYETPAFSTHDIADIVFTNENVGYFSAENSYYDYYKTTDGGYSWTAIEELDYQVENVSFLGKIDNETLITSSASALSPNDDLKGTYRVTQGGQIWTEVYDNSLMDISVVSSNLLYGFTYNDLDYPIVTKSEDGGESWQNIYEFNEENLTFVDLEFSDELTGYCLPSGSGSQYYKTTDGGLTWELVDFLEQTGSWNSSIKFADYDHGYIQKGNYLYITNNGGETWEYNGSYNSMINIDVFGNYFFRYGDDGLIYRQVIPSILSSEDHYQEESDWNLFPNPTSGILTINTSMLIFDRIQIVDLGGRVVKEISSFHSELFSVDLTSERSGIYFVLIYSEKGLLTKKLILL